MVKKRHEALRREHEQMAAALQTIERGTLLAEQLKTQLRHEKMVLEQKKEVFVLSFTAPSSARFAPMRCFLKYPI